MVQCDPFFLNIILLNKDAVVAQKVNEKAGITSKGIFAKAAGFAANKMITDEKVLTGLSDNLIDGVNKAITDMGISAKIEKRFQYGTYVVIRLQIEDIDVMSLILAAKGEDFASNFSTLLVASKNLGMGDTVALKVDEKISSSVNEGMMKKFMELIPAKMAENGIEVECHACSTHDQADFFYNTYEKLSTK